MHWNQIADRWAAMTERLRHDGPSPGQGARPAPASVDALHSTVPVDPAAPGPVPPVGTPPHPDATAV